MGAFFITTMQAETLEDLFEWKAALEHALAQAPNAALVMGQNGIFRNDSVDTIEGSAEQCKAYLINVTLEASASFSACLLSCLLKNIHILEDWHVLF
jgi:hypothetical protein